MGAPAPVLLRPLGVGEIIDRALTLYVRNFVVFTATVLAVIFIPIGIAQYLLLGNEFGELQAFLQVMQHPNAPPPTLLNANASAQEVVVGLAMLLLFMLLLPFANNAVAINTAAIYRGRRPSIWYALGATFRRAGPLIALLLLEALIGMGAYLVFGILFAAGAFAAVAGAGGNAGAFAVIPIVVVGIVVLLAFFVLAVLFVIALTFAGYAVVIERNGAVEALSSGFARVFNRREWSKAVLIGLVAMMLGLGVSAFSSLGGFALAFIPGSHVLETIWSTLVDAVSAAIQTVFYAVYYFDVRVRREGLDLEEALGRLAPSTS